MATESRALVVTASSADGIVAGPQRTPAALHPFGRTGVVPGATTTITSSEARR